MTGATMDWWRARAPRERLLLLVMFVGLAAFIGWFAVLVPLARLADAATDRRTGAAALLMEVRAARDELQSFAASRPQQEFGAPVGPLLARTAGAAGVPLSNQRQEGDRLTVGIDAVGAPDLLRWLDTLSRDHGIAPVAMDVGERNGHLHAQLVFDAGGSATEP